MPMAARLALPVNVFVANMVDSFMTMLLSLRFHFSIGMPHHLSCGKLLSCGSLPLIRAKFRYQKEVRNVGSNRSSKILYFVLCGKVYSKSFLYHSSKLPLLT